MSTSTSAFQALSLSQVQSDLLDLYRRVACQQGRVEIVDEAGECDCVLISKAELDSLEKAIAILADGDTVRELSGHLSDLAAIVEPEHAGA
jgi:hypothetical protein